MVSRLKSVFRIARLNSLDGVEAKSVCSFCSSAHPDSGEYGIRHFHIVKEITGASEEQVLKLLVNNVHIQSMSEEEVQKGLIKYKGLGITEKSKGDILRLLKLHTLTAVNRTMVLQEAGFIPSALTVSAILKYLMLSKIKIRELKEKKYIKCDTNVWQHMASFLDQPIAKPSTDQVTDDGTIISLKKDILKHYLQCKLDMPIEQFEKNVIFHRLNHKSLRILCENIDLAINVLNISLSKIRNNPFLIVLNPENTLEILDKIKEIGGMDIRHAINTHPKILGSTCDTLLQIKQHLKDYRIPDESILKCVEVFTLSCDTVLKRLQELDQNELFQAYRQHPRVLELIMYQKRAIKRFNLLKERKIHNTSLNLVASTPEARFEKFYEVGGSEKFCRSDILNFLSSELNTDKNSLRTALDRHPFSAYVPLVQIGKNLTTLKNLGFTDDLILKNLCVLLYPMERIVSEIDKLKEGPGPEYDYCKGSDGSIRQDLLLQLAMYNIEKTCNFTGEALWTSGYCMDQEQTNLELS